MKNILIFLPGNSIIKLTNTVSGGKIYGIK